MKENIEAYESVVQDESTGLFPRVVTSTLEQYTDVSRQKKFRKGGNNRAKRKRK